ncbi:MAG: hypothetical protein ABI912_04460 [Actinomycetota bacterium]
MSLLAVMGSGETAPTMIRTHRALFEQTYAGVSRGADDAVMLDTPFAFQMNVDELTAKTRAYFADSVGQPVVVARWRSADAPVLEREAALALLGRARWAFAGPGSPTYALRQWIGTPLPEALADVARRGGTLLLGSAAAVTVGTHAIPVYEIYKVGETPRWVPGLDLLGVLTGIHAVVVPHYNNAEGGGHDTRFCYLGERRLAVLEADLPDEIGVLGVDEHTALVIDIEAATATVSGNGVVTVRRRGQSSQIAPGSVLSLEELAAGLRGATVVGVEGGAKEARPGVRAGGAGATVEAGRGGPSAGSLRDVAEQHRLDFEAALARRDVSGCTGAILGLEEAIVEWSRDSLQSDDNAVARRVLRALVVRLGELAVAGAREPRSVVAPYVDLLVELRRKAREGKDFATSDLVRDRLAAARVELRDTPSGAEWDLKDC